MNKVEIYVKSGETYSSQSISVITEATKSYNSVMILNSSNYQVLDENMVESIYQFDTTVRDVEMDIDGKPIYAGNFISFPDSILPIGARIVKLNHSGTLNNTYSSIASLSSSSLYMNVIKPQPDGTLLAGGFFPSASGWAPNNSVVKYLPATGSNALFDFTFKTPTTLLSSSIVTNIEVSGSTVYIGGDINMVSGSGFANRGLIGFDTGSGTPISTNRKFTGNVISTKVINGKRLFVGNFIQFNTSSCSNIVMLNSDWETIDTTFNSGDGFNDIASCIETDPDGNIYIGGLFTTYNNQPSNLIVKLDSSGNIISSFSPQFSPGGEVRKILYKSDTNTLLIGGGNLTTYNTIDIGNFIEIDATTGDYIPNFAENVIGFNNNVWDINVSNRKIYVVGDFTQYDYQQITTTLESVLVPTYDRLDMFDDENISIKMKAKDSSDISKVFSPYSQNFTIPASGKNNRLLNYYFNPDVSRSSQKYIDAKIYVNKDLFRTGNIIIEDGKFKYGNKSSYSVRFFTTLTSLKDIVKDDKLSDVNVLGDLDFDYTPLTAKIYLQSPAPINNLIIPMVSRERVWSWGDGTTSDISSSANSIKYNELRPAVSFDKITNEIINKYGLDVDFNFINDRAFRNIYMWLNNTTEAQLREYNFLNQYSLTTTVNTSSYFYTPTASLGNDSVTINTTFNGPNSQKNLMRLNNILYIKADNFNDDENISYTAKFIDDRPGTEGNVLYEATADAAPNATTAFNWSFSALQYDITPSNPLKFRIELSANKPIFNIDTDIRFLFSNWNTPFPYEKATWVSNNNELLGNVFDVNKSFPDVKVIDFLSSIWKTFNIKVIEDPLTRRLLWLTPGEFYNQIVDYTPYVDITEYTGRNVPKYKKIDFKHNTSKFYSSEAFKIANVNNPNSKEFGNLIYNSSDRFDTEEYKVETKFNITPPRLVENTNLQYLYGWEYEETPTGGFKPNIESLIFYYEGYRDLLNVSESNLSANFKFNDGTSNISLSKYHRVGIADFSPDGNYTNTLGFQQEVNIDPNNSFVYQNTLYTNYYKDEIDRIYNTNTRIFEYNLVLPSNVIKDFNLRNIVLIGDKKFTIEDADINLVTGKTKLRLMNLAPQNINISSTPSNPTIFTYEFI